MSLIVGEQGYVSQGNNGNFNVIRIDKWGRFPLPVGDVSLNRSDFAKIFGRIPSSGITLRADVFIRLCRLSGILLYFHDLKSPSEVPIGKDYDTRVPMIQATNEIEDDSFTPTYGLFLNDEGNFNLLPVSKREQPLSTITLPISMDRFESMFGLDVRDYFANEAIRIAALAGIPLKATFTNKL